MALGKEEGKENGVQEHKAPSASCSCLAVNRRECSQSKHVPAQEELGMGGMSSAKDRRVVVAWSGREQAEICMGLKCFSERGK